MLADILKILTYLHPFSPLHRPQILPHVLLLSSLAKKKAYEAIFLKEGTIEEQT